MTEEQARKRFMILNLVRLGALVMAFAGVLNIAGTLLPDLAPGLGYGLLIFGAFDFFAAPILLKRAWRNADR
jgi:amino acid transporter